MIEYEVEIIKGADLELGFRGDHVHFRHRKFEDRPDEHKQDYAYLKRSIELYGIKKPLIVFDNHVLIGMRRYEVAMSLYEKHVFSCAVITENVNKWTREDLPRLEELKNLIGEFKY